MRGSSSVGVRSENVFALLAMSAMLGFVAQACGSSNNAGPGRDGGADASGSGGRSGGTGSMAGGGTSGTGGGGVGAGTGGRAAGGATGTTECNDGIDNDSDGKVDLGDTECVSPLDDDESSFATGISGDNMDACKQDCFFDGNSGMGNDGCEWNLACDPKNPGGNSCPYNPTQQNCPAAQSDRCLMKCFPLTPSGCDCFGCCTVPGTDRSVRLSGTCTAEDFDDPAACQPCTQSPSCQNDCKPCELCLGKTTLPPECGAGGASGAGGAGGASGTGGAGGGWGGIDCGVYTPCGTDASACNGISNTLCVSGCCVPFIP